MGASVITIFVRHGEGCKYAADEFSRRCNCRKHFRWTQNGTQYRRKVGTRSWEEAEEAKRQLQDELTGRTPEAKPEDNVRSVSKAVELFLEDIYHGSTKKTTTRRSSRKHTMSCCRRLWTSGHRRTFQRIERLLQTLDR
jgi:hypothetical protein